MGDNEIIKALGERGYSGKWIGKGFLDKKDFLLLKNALDLINRQKAKIEGLKKQNSISQRLLSEAWHSIEEKDKFCETVKTEAIREFGKFLINKSKNGMVSIADIPDYVKEMTEGENDKN